MSDLIRRSDAVKAVASHFALKAEMRTGGERSWEDFKDAVGLILAKCETVDAVQGSHGKWIRTGRPNIYGGTELECNLCKDRVMVQDVSREHYCRNCGARMDEEEP